MKIKLPLFLLSLCVLTTSCRSEQGKKACELLEKDHIAQVPNYFKHGMNGPVKKTQLETFFTEKGKTERWPTNFLVLWGDKDCESFSIKEFDKEGNKIKEKSLDEGATRTDTTTIIYNYESNRIASRQISAIVTRFDQIRGWVSEPETTTDEYIYSSGTIINEDSNEKYILGDDGQIVRKIIDSSISLYENSPKLEIIHDETYSPNGIMLDYTDHKSTLMTNRQNEKGLIVEAYSRDKFGLLAKTIEYVKFDDYGNWTERIVKSLYPDGKIENLVQKKTITYY